MLPVITPDEDLALRLLQYRARAGKHGDGFMPIPPLNEHGLLPAGLHDCTLAEILEAFGQNRWVVDEASETHREVLCPRRRQLFARLEIFLNDLRRVGLPVVVLVNGSFVTAKPDPNDVDLVVVLPADHDFVRGLPPQEYDLLSKRRLRGAGYPFDLFVVADGNVAYQKAIQLYQRVRDHEELIKGLLRVKP
jgi:hypothetical protein